MNLIERYEREARYNRPDWDDFLAEARACPVEITYEVEECGYPHSFDFDMMLVAVEEWLTDPRTSQPTRYFAPPDRTTVQVFHDDATGCWLDAPTAADRCDRYGNPWPTWAMDFKEVVE